MRAVEYTATGDPDVLTLVNRPMSDPGPGEVRVRVQRSGVNPTDWKSRRGSAAGAVVDPPQVPNQDGSGVVAAIGQGVEAALLGLRVWVWEAAHLGPAGGTAQEALRRSTPSCRHVTLCCCRMSRRSTSAPA
ncbi:MAG: alcohol dehydrogenase catalytic domain-containing protein [Nocardioidaceae bacterium]